MSNFALAGLDAVIHGAFAAVGLADAGTYTAPGGQGLPCRCYVDRSVQQMGDGGHVSGPRTLVTLVREGLPEPVAGAVVTVGAETWELEAEVSRDEGVSRWVVSHVRA